MCSPSLSANGKQSLSFISSTYSTSTFSCTHCSGGFTGSARRRTWPWPQAQPPQPPQQALCTAHRAWWSPLEPCWETYPPWWSTCSLPRPWSLPGLPLSRPKISPWTCKCPSNRIGVYHCTFPKFFTFLFVVKIFHHLSWYYYNCEN